MQTTINAAGQVFTVKGRHEDIATVVKAARTSAVGTLRDFEKVGGGTVTIDAAAVATIETATTRAAVGFR